MVLVVVVIPMALSHRTHIAFGIRVLMLSMLMQSKSNMREMAAGGMAVGGMAVGGMVVGGMVVRCLSLLTSRLRACVP